MAEDVIPLSAEKPALTRDRITIVETAHYQVLGEEPVSVLSRFGLNIESGQYPYSRRLRVGEHWQELDLGLARPGLILIKNEEGRFPQVIPTEAERLAVSLRQLEVCLVSKPGQGPKDGKIPPGIGSQTPFAIIPPLASVRLFVPNNVRYAVRCYSGDARFSIHVFPG